MNAKINSVGVELTIFMSIAGELFVMQIESII